eukprot:SAG11_NODE_13213_length_665_cov_1.150177_2_plen_23_part_01
MKQVLITLQSVGSVQIKQLGNRA